MPRVIGLMSGTSLDGVDAACLETDGERVHGFGRALTLPYDAVLRADLRRLIDRAPTLPTHDPDLLDAIDRLTRHHAAVIAALEEPGAELIGFHGQTILHAPAERRTWQIGDASLLARLTGLPVVHDFRSADVAAGGQGAPLAPLYHAALAADLPRPLCILNIGGVANLTWLGDGAIENGGLLACDTGPGNALLDDWAERHTGMPCDTGGRLALAGGPDQAVLSRLLAHPFFAAPAPKSLDRQSFAGALAAIAHLSPADGAATLVAFTVGAIAATRLPARPRRWLVCGGGRHNPALMRALRQSLAAPVDSVDALGWDGDALEAQCFGHLAERARIGLPISVPGATGVSRPLGGGRLIHPSS